MEQAVNIHHNFCQCERCTYTVGCQAPLIASLQALQMACQHCLPHHQLQKQGPLVPVSAAVCLYVDSAASPCK